MNYISPVDVTITGFPASHPNSARIRRISGMLKELGCNMHGSSDFHPSQIIVVGHRPLIVHEVTKREFDNEEIVVVKIEGNTPSLEVTSPLAIDNRDPNSVASFITRQLLSGDTTVT
jgi:hypothetical protein